ncbi:uncharacterized protein Z518_03820 [Rhinocladiella mackenziei CBS 650.93]|uniref:Rhinocladiella mackenziei CBS 650.93 unplaced genomic scaffold supercont1.3, whole genome shotgun sequence n=1 Tax=Rhinocladiella mackenziei CBS 650.93 TaxID=1442369 RepID=A0A0D2FUT6_9EURO|nr:uncharacterized protein Z518_03820 [Rhinocladiella mackenziei CBS 650.93]KIX05847.1 hypothetical protein Z518_03820 [Rhinocladiella mackenziei CBS 650.93]
MSYPAPPGLSSSTSQPPASLPARPPPSTVSPAPPFRPALSATSPNPALTAFAPRSVATANTYRTSSPAHYAATPVPSYGTGTQHQQTTQPQYDPTYSAAPQIRNPFVPTPDTSSSNAYLSGYDAEYEAQVQQWQSAYMNKENGNASSSISKSAGGHNASTGSTSRNEPTAQTDNVPKTVHRSGGGMTWTDSTLLEWDPAHFRIFVGNLAGEVTDDSLLKAFSQYPSVQKARVIRDKRTTKSKGYGFVSFADGDDYFRAAREQNGKYVGSHPIVVKKATTDIRPSTVKQNHHKGKSGAGGHGKVEHGGVHKKGPKTKGGLKVLG